MEISNIAFGRALRKFRKAAKLTQEQLAFEAEIQRVYVSTLELGQQQPSLATIFKLAKGLGCGASELILETEKEMLEMKKPREDKNAV